MASSTIDRKKRLRPIRPTPEPAARRPMLDPITTATEQSRSYFMTIDRLLQRSSIAYRLDRSLQTKMRRDPDIMAPLFHIQMGVALSEWTIAPDDKRDRMQVDAAKELTRAMKRTPRMHEFVRCLTDCNWYGHAGVNVIYGRNSDGMLYPKRWLPMHPDALACDEDGNIGIRVGARYYGAKGGEDTVQGHDARVRLFTPLERQAVVFSTFFVEGPDYDEPWETATPFMGTGLRDVCWFMWTLKQTILQLWATFCERYAMGIRKAYHPASQEGRLRMEEIVTNMIGDMTIMLPRSDPENPEYDVEIMEASATAADVFARAIDWTSGKLKELIAGQTATSEATPSGLGSTVADQHANTQSRTFRYLAKCVEDAMDRDMVGVMFRHNMKGASFPRPRLSLAVERPDPMSFLNAVKTLVRDLGVEVSEDDIREVVGFARPEEGDRVISLAGLRAIENAMSPGPVLSGEDASVFAGALAS